MNTDVNKRDSEAGESSVDTNGNKSRDHEACQRLKFSAEDLERLGAVELRSAWRKQDAYIESLEKNYRAQEDKISLLNRNEEKLKQQLADLGIRERILMRRLVNKEQELQEYAREISDLKSGSGSNVNVRSAMVDPAVNLIIQKLRQELTQTKTKLEDTQNELNAWKFTPDSNTGKRLMAKCRLLYQENEELGRMISSGRLAKLEGELALQKSFGEEVKKSQSEMDELLQDLDEDVEGMQSTILYLQQELLRLKRDGNTPPCNGLENNHSTDAQQQRATGGNQSDPRTLVKNNDSRKRTTPHSENSELNFSDSLDSDQPQPKKTQNHLNGLVNSPPP